MDIERLVKRKQRAKRDNNLLQLAQVIKDLGDIYFETKRLDDALLEYTEQLEIWNLLNDKLKSAVAHRMIGEVYASLGNYEQALKHQNFHLEGAREVKNLLEQQRALATLGRTYFCLAESLPHDSETRNEALSNARKAYLKSIRLCDELESTDIHMKELIIMRARLLLNLGLVLEAEKEHQQAIDLMEKASILCKEHKLHEDFHRTQIALSGIYERRANYELSLKHLEAATQIEDISLKTEAQLSKAEILLRLEKWIDARKVLVSLYTTKELPQNLKPQVEKSLRIVATLHATERAVNTEKDLTEKLKLYETLGDAAAAANCYEKAVDYYRKMLLCAEETNSERLGAALISLAQTLKDIGRYEEALTFARKELQLCTDPREICRSALFLADLLIATKEPHEQIQDTYDLALQNAKKCGNDSLEASVIKDQLHYLKNSEKIEEAIILEEKLREMEILLSVTDSGDESEDDHVGENICLEDLSDVENELKSKEAVRINRKRTREKPHIVKKNVKGETQLHVACINGNIEIAEKLLSLGHPTNVRDHFGWSPLHEAANHGHVEIAELLLKHGANVDDLGGPLCQGVTPLHDAASCGNLSMMQLLMKYGANVTLKTGEGDTALECLEQWRSRVDNLSFADQTDYDEIHKKLSAVMPARARKDKKLLDESPSLINEISDDEDTVEKISAGEDYKRTIASLKHRGEPIGKLLNRKGPKNIGPLINSSQIVTDDWLEDDLGTSAGRKISTENFTVTTKRKSSDTYTTSEKSSKRPRKNVSIEDDISSTSEESRDSNNSEITEIFDASEPLKRKQQVSLLSIGFTKNSTSLTPSPRQTPTFNDEPRKVASAREIMVLNVLIDGKEFITEVELSNEARPLLQNILADLEEKFYNENGCKAKLHLRTDAGAVVEPHDLLEILERGETVKNLKCDIVDLELPPIVDRYETICKTYNTVVHENISKCLKACENTSILRLKQDDISKEDLVSVLKTLEYQKNVQTMHFSDGILHGSGKVLNDCVMKLSNLQELYLQCCHIDFECLSKLEKLPVQLKLLDFSYNPLRSISQEILYKLLTPLKQLRTLNLCYCELTSFRFPPDNSTLVNLDISWNSIDEDGVSCLSQRQLVDLNLSHTIYVSQFDMDRNFLSKLNFLFLESLELACCDLSDTDVENILSRALNLVRFVLSGNTKVTIQSTNKLLAYTPTLKHIDVSGCMSITEHPDPVVLIENPKTCQFVASMVPHICECWLDLWRGHGTMSKLPHDLVIFKPIEDIAK